ncbi:MAG: class I adenylate-forming enzyme family protein [Burkholderiales bacterium]
MRVDQMVAAVAASSDGAARTALAPEDGCRISYLELAQRIDAAAPALAQQGLGAGQRAVLVGENSVDMVVLLLAVTRLRAWAVPLNARMSPAEIDAICAHAEPALVYCASRSSTEAAEHARRLGAVRAEAAPLADGLVAVRAGEGTCSDGSGESSSDSGSPDEVALMIYTSGSTGTPKGVMLTHANLDFVTRASLAQQVLLPGDAVFHALPISHSFGLISALLCGLRAGATLHLMTRFSAEKLAHAILHDGITVFQGVPAMYARLHEWADHNGQSLTPNHLRMAYIGGSQIDPARKAQAESLLGLRLHHGYGLTESAPAASRTIGHPAPTDVSAGWPIPGIEVVLRDAQGRELPTGEQGEVCIRGANVMKGYFRDPAATRAAIDADGWLHTGDVGVFRPAGDLLIVGRSKEMIIRGGFNVYPAEVENAIAAYPDVAQCAVVGRTRDGDEEIVAYIEPQAGRTVDVDGLKAFLRRRLAPYKQPSQIVCVARLPATTTGKLLKAQIKALAAADLMGST